MDTVYALTPYVLGNCLGIGVFRNEAEARDAQRALEDLAREDGVTVEWIDHGYVTNERAQDIALNEALADLLDSDDFL